MIKILHTEPFLPLGKAIPKPAPAAPQAREIKPGIWQAPDGKLETRDPTPMVITPIPAPSSNLAEVCAEAIRQLEAVCGTALIGFKPAETPLPVVPNSLCGPEVGDRVVVINGPSVKRFANWFKVGDTGVVNYVDGHCAMIKFDGSGKSWAANYHDIAAT
jgi:hypothetical protein